jgi:Phosphotransferase enzyme family.
MLLLVWRELGEVDRKRCMIQLQGYIEQLRSLIPPEPGKVQSVDGECLTDGRLGYDEWGPFESHDAFNNFFNHENVRKLSRRYPLAQAPLAVTKGRTWRTVFAHGDLGPHNILWDTKQKKIAAIIDWEFAGWFPEYWEYTRAYFGPATFQKEYGWWQMFQEFTDCYREELDVEIILSDYFTLNL